MISTTTSVQLLILTDVKRWFKRHRLLPNEAKRLSKECIRRTGKAELAQGRYGVCGCLTTAETIEPFEGVSLGHVLRRTQPSDSFLRLLRTNHPDDLRDLFHFSRHSKFSDESGTHSATSCSQCTRYDGNVLDLECLCRGADGHIQLRACHDCTTNLKRDDLPAHALANGTWTGTPCPLGLTKAEWRAVTLDFHNKSCHFLRIYPNTPLEQCCRASTGHCLCYPQDTQRLDYVLIKFFKGRLRWFRLCK